jgi:DNA repair exonuclease SbcCD ATPase subunit
VESTEVEEGRKEVEPSPSQNGTPQINGVSASNGTDTADRLEALAQERDALRTEVSELRKSLEAIQSKHEEEVTGLQDELEESNTGKEKAENQYQELLVRVNTIRSQLGERLKSDAVRLNMQPFRCAL